MRHNRRDSAGLQLVRALRHRGILDARVLEAIGRVPRDRFVPRAVLARAWQDQALPIGCDQTISQPFMVALMTQELRLKGDESVLEIGTGSGYQSAILGLLAREVYTVERHGSLAQGACAMLGGLGITNVRFRLGDGSLGWPEYAPYDRILVTAAAPRFPQALFDQLAEGGRLVVPIDLGNHQRLHLIDRRAGEPIDHPSVGCRFVPLIGQGC